MRRRPWMLAALAGLLVIPGLTPPASAQLDQIPLPPLPTPDLLKPSPSPSPAPAPAAPPPPAPAPPAAAQSSSGKGTVPAPKKGAAAKPSPQASPFPLKVPSFRRSGPGNTSRQVGALQELTEFGMPRDEVVRLGMTPFPVAGPARYTHDWLNPRYTPTPHLHHGIDIFAAFGTPVVASGGGRIATFGRGGAGGLSVWVEADDGTALYYAHLLSVPKGLQRGQRVERGSIIGYVGNSGNAEGGPPHLHFQWHPPVRNRKGQVTASGVSVSGYLGLNRAPAVDPKPLVDGWLREAEENIPRFVAEQKQRLAGGVGPGAQAIPTVRPRQLLLLSSLDPAVGVLGLVREAIEATGVGGLLGGFEGTDPEVQSIARLAVDAPYVRLAEMTGDLAGDRPRTMVAGGTTADL